MVTVIGPRDPKDKDAIIVCSISNNWSKGLSPFILGPVRVPVIKAYGRYWFGKSMTMENAWQYSKVYSGMVSWDGEPTETFFRWAQRGFNSRKADRYPMGKGAIPSYSYWGYEKLGYIDARKKIYIPCYRDSVFKSEAYKTLRSIYHKHGEIVLWDLDGYNHRSLNMTYSDVVEDPNKTMGHGFILAMMLEGVI